MATKGGSKLPSGFLKWGCVHSLAPDYGTLMHVTQHGDNLYTGSTKSGIWEIIRWQTDSAECGSVRVAAPA